MLPHMRLWVLSDPDDHSARCKVISFHRETLSCLWICCTSWGSRFYGLRYAEWRIFVTLHCMREDMLTHSLRLMNSNALLSSCHLLFGLPQICLFSVKTWVFKDRPKYKVSIKVKHLHDDERALINNTSTEFKERCRIKVMFSPKKY